MGRPRKKLFCPWKHLAWEEHQEAQDFVKMHPDGGNLREIGRAMGFSGERARQIYEDAISKLRDYFGVNPDEVHEYRERPPSLDDIEDEFSDDEEQESWAA